MKCKKVNILLIRYIEDDLGKGLKSEIEQHLGLCPKCNGELNTLRHILEVSKYESIPSPPGSYWERYVPRLYQKIREAVPSGGHSSTRWEWAWTKILRWAVPVCATVLLLTLYFRSAPLSPLKEGKPLIPPKPAREVTFLRPPSGVASVEVKETIEKEPTLFAIAEGMDAIYNPVLETTRTIEKVYYEVCLLEEALEQQEVEEGYSGLIQGLSEDERKILATRIESLL